MSLSPCWSPCRPQLFGEVAERHFIGLKLMTSEVKRERQSVWRCVWKERSGNADKPIAGDGHLARVKSLAEVVP